MSLGNEVSLARLAELSRGARRTLPEPALVSQRCPSCGTEHRRKRKRCSRCGAKLPERDKPRCRLCDDPVEWPKRSWCSEECSEAYYLVVSGAFVREKAFERDHGVCASCGLDTESVRRRVQSLPRDARRAAVVELIGLGFNGYPAAYNPRLYSLWDADHIVPLAEGGSYRLDNVQTLCVPCHKEKTAEQAARKAKQRRLIGRKWLRDRERRRTTIGALVGLEREGGTR